MWAHVDAYQVRSVFSIDSMMNINYTSIFKLSKQRYWDYQRLLRDAYRVLSTPKDSAATTLLKLIKYPCDLWPLGKLPLQATKLTPKQRRRHSSCSFGDDYCLYIYSCLHLCHAIFYWNESSPPVQSSDCISPGVLHHWSCYKGWEIYLDQDGLSVLQSTWQSSSCKGTMPFWSEVNFPTLVANSVVANPIVAPWFCFCICP